MSGDSGLFIFRIEEYSFEVLVVSVDIPRELIDAVKNKKLVIFIGAGASIKEGLPSWNDIVSKVLDEKGEYIEKSEAFKSALDRAGIEDFKFRDLMHTFASHMIMRGASLKEVQETFGHGTTPMTLRYAHLSQDHKKKAVNLLNGLTALPNSCDKDCHNYVINSNPSTSANGRLPDITGRGGEI